MDAYLAKPVDPTILIATLEAVPDETSVACDPENSLVDVFRAEAPRLFRDIHEAIARRDGAALRFAAHRLKGAVTNFHAPVVSDAVERFELLVRSAESTGGTFTWDEIEQALRRLTVTIGELNREDPAPL